MAPAEDPVGGHFGRNPDGTSNGRAYETSSIFICVLKVLAAVVPHALLSVGKFGKVMAQNGITACSEHTFSSNMAKSYIAITSVLDAPQRIALYHMSIEKDCADKIKFPASEEMLWKQGIKLWADGSPWVGNIASSFPYNNHEMVRKAQIPLGPGGTKNMNYIGRYSRHQRRRWFLVCLPRQWRCRPGHRVGCLPSSPPQAQVDGYQPQMAHRALRG
jgi:hypothetical protein